MKLYYTFRLVGKRTGGYKMEKFFTIVPDFLNIIDEPWKYSGLRFKSNKFMLNNINNKNDEDMEVEEINKNNASLYKKEINNMLSAIDNVNFHYWKTKAEISILYMRSELESFLKGLIGDDAHENI